MAFIIILALAAALFNATSAVIQRRIAGEPSIEELFRRDFMKNLTTNKIWLAGFGLQVLAFVCQAGALRTGSLIVVEPLLTVDLIFLMLILHFRYKVAAGPREWGAIALMCLGLSGLIASTNPQTGHRAFDAGHWLGATGVALFIIAAGVYIVRRTRNREHRAGISGLAAGFSFALVAMFTKLVTEQFHHGIGAVFGGWQLYALFLAGILSIIMAQNTYGAGPVAVSQPVMEMSEPVISIMAAVFLFGDAIDLSNWALAAEAVTGLMTLIGIWMLSHSENLHASRL